MTTIQLDIDGHVATLTLNRPDAMNALSAQLKADLAATLDRLAREDVRALVVTGAGEKAFCAGADLKERSGQSPSPSEFMHSQRVTLALFSALEAFPAPTIAAMNGFAFGGGLELALCCDIRIAAERVKLGLTEVKLGAIPAAGGTQRLTKLIGAGRTKELLFLSKILTAEQAASYGIVNRVCPNDELLVQASEMAAEIAKQPPIAVRLAKRVVDAGATTDLATGLELELQAAAILFDTEDRKEGMAAFVEKRAPVFKGR